LFFLALTCGALGDYIIGLDLGLNVVTWIILILALFLFITRFEIYVDHIFLTFLIFLLFQTFLYNYYNIDFSSSFKHLLFFLVAIFAIFRFSRLFINDLNRLFNIYINISIFTILIGYFQIVLYITMGITFKPQDIISGLNSYSFETEIIGLIPRPTSIFSEPAHFSTFLLPSVLISLHKLLNKNSYFKISNIISAFVVIGFILTFSLVGYFGVLLWFVFQLYRKKVLTLKSKVLISLLLLLSFHTLITSRLSSKLFSLKDQIADPAAFEYSSSDLSGFALVSNAIVSYNSLKSSGYLGSGFNTHKLSYDKYIPQFFSEVQILMELNRDDAGSLYLRLISELGLPGLFFFIFFLYKFKLRNSFQNSYTFINDISLVVLIFYGFRQGSYLNVYFIFFASLYYYTFKKYAGKNIEYL
jgi:hypothetical protein